MSAKKATRFRDAIPQTRSSFSLLRRLSTAARDSGVMRTELASLALVVAALLACGGVPPDPAWCQVGSSTSPLTVDDSGEVDGSGEDVGSVDSAITSGKGAETGNTFMTAVRLNSGWTDQVEKKHWAIWYWFHGYAPDLKPVQKGKTASGVLVAQNLVLTTADAVNDGQPIEQGGQAGFLVEVHMPVLDKQITMAYPTPVIELSGGFAVIDPSGADLALVFVEPSNSGKDKRYALPEMPVMYDWSETTKCCSKQHLMLVSHGDDGVRRSSLAQVRAGSGDASKIQLSGNGAEAGDMGAPWLAKLRMDQVSINPAYPWTIVGLQHGEVSGSTGLNDSPGEKANRNEMVKIKKSTIDWIKTAVEDENNRREEAWYSFYYGSAGDEVEGDPTLKPDFSPLSDFVVGTPYTHQFTSLNDDCSNGSKGTVALGDGVCIGTEHTLGSTTQPLMGGTKSYANVPSIGDVQNDKGEHLCTGTLLSEYHVLTAAHCVVVRTKLDKDVDPDHLKRVFKFRTSEKDAKTVDGWATVNPSYSWADKTGPIGTSNDLAVIHLKSALTLKEPWGLRQLWPFNLPKTFYMRLARDYTTCANLVFAYGDGQRGPSDFVYSQGYDTLAYLVLSGDAATTQDKTFKFTTSRPGDAIRPGDSGGPTVVIRASDGVFFQIGVHSTGKSDGYTDTRLVQEHIDWIQTTINDSTSAPSGWEGGSGSSPPRTVQVDTVPCQNCGGKPKKGP
jgi:hypothetical protein